jgi:hypothetical protein
MEVYEIQPPEEDKDLSTQLHSHINDKREKSEVILLRGTDLKTEINSSVKPTLFGLLLLIF